MPDLDAIRQRVNAATPGPWHAEDKGAFHEIYTKGLGTNPLLPYEPPILLSSSEPDEEIRREDAEFIVHAREDVPVLLDEIDRLREELRQAEHVAATHLFDHEALSTREAIRTELIEQGLKDSARLVEVRARCRRHVALGRVGWGFARVILESLDGESTKDGA